MSASEKLLRFVAAIPLVAAAFGFSACLLIWSQAAGQEQNSPLDALGMGIIFTVFAIPFVALLLSVVALPISILLDALKLHGVIVYTLIGGFAGAACFYALLSSFVGFGDGGAARLASCFGIAPGLTGGLYWWWSVDRHRERNPWRSE